ncbi:MAG: leucyl/phenylalanyl-tRNA--protein transferase [Geminocystis sp.]|nr:leucyl/phenylalanyl-tRNA--protein transferase [Geminocystis sp.]HIK37093.1 leucyl/phenylalanyl-tRNA--protein transferase [Geminocystis sp. M7585_C2015_104]MCS7148617.1 leucyl/phenylalanyl-tRNA--protein transferase [Geminocystis sp.]MCX8079391.1 leucyl/phenylalanyl-tRNA--protein transferase [Geminocystis sp.]MDW8114991.1 leucyl/phenylalanyl-tRNA--protein transferase [Geminocystis sp.]
MIDIATIIQGYAQGNFLMADENQRLAWYSSNRRALIPLDDRFRYPKSLRRILNKNCFSVAINRDFLGVCLGCANRPTTWISPELIEIYLELNKAGWAYSFETWLDGQLAGGILGIVLRGAFIGESMFYNVPNASKVAMVKLVAHLRKQGFVLFDAQLQNPHLERFGAYVVSHKEYLQLLAKALSKPCTFLVDEKELNAL